MSEKSKKTSTKTSSSKKSTTSKAKTKNKVVDSIKDDKVVEVEMATEDSVRASSVDIEQPIDAKEASISEPTEKASKVFGNIAAYSWYNKLSWVNIAWTFGIVLLILAFAWKAADANKYTANVIFASIVSAISFIAISLIVIFYFFVKRIKSFDKKWEYITMISAFIPLGFIIGFVSTSFEKKIFFNNEKVTSLGYKKPKFVMPHVYIILLVIIFVIIVVSWLVTWTGSPANKLDFNVSSGNDISAAIAATLGSDGKWSVGVSDMGSLTPEKYSELMTNIGTTNTALSSLSANADINQVIKLIQDNIKGTGNQQWNVGDAAITYAQSSAGFLYLLVAPIEGFVNAADLIIFLLIMGGFLAIVTESGALEAGLGRMVKRLQGKEIILIPILFLLFSVGGATYGMAEETIPFYLLLIPVFLAAGFDTYTAFLVILLGAGLGTAASILNPFVVNTATSAVNNAGSWSGGDLSPSIGIVWRSVIYVVLVIAGCSYVTWYGWRVKKHPEKSAVYDLRKEHEKQFSFNLNSLPEFTVKRKIILALFAITFISMIISVITWPDVANTEAFSNAANWVNTYFPFIGGVNKDGSGMIGAWGTWYLVEMSFLFFLSSIVIGLLSWKGSLHFINKFMAGAADFIGVGIVISISRGISLAVSKTGLDTIIINGLTGMMQGIGNVYGVTIIFFLVFFALSFLIPSTSGFASAVFPIIGPAIGGFGHPVALNGLTISGSIASFSLASGIVNISMPSGGIFMSALSVSNIPLGKFYKASWWFLLVLIGLSLMLLLIGQAINGNTTSNTSIF